MNIALIGNPNCGKTTLFNLLTGSTQRVGNWPGVTVERKSGVFNYHQRHYHIIDLPGTYAIENNNQASSQDEMITRDYILSAENDIIINIIDATNLQRSLYLTMQLIDLNLPMIIVLNMIDALEDLGEYINKDKLTQLLGYPVVTISASKKIGLENLYQLIENSVTDPLPKLPIVATLAKPQEQIIAEHLSNLPDTSKLKLLNRWQLLEGLIDHHLLNLTRDELTIIDKCRHELAAQFDGELDVALASSRYEVIDQICKMVISSPREASSSLSEKIDRITLGRITGVPCFLLVIYLMFMFAVKLGSVFIDFFDGLFSAICVEGFGHILINIGAPDWLIVILANGIGSGIQTVASFIPIIAAMFFCLSFLEDSGYLARAAMVVDRGMRMIGLPGKAFVPMLVGFGCGVPAIMGTRTLESTRDRIMSICMIPFMSCNARLPVYVLLAVIFFPQHTSTVVFILYLLGIVIAIATGLLLKFTLLKGEITPFIMEMPAYRIPTLKSMLHLTWQRLKSFIFKAGKAIVLMVMILSILNSISRDGTFGHENTDESILALASHSITPIFTPMGVTQQNWPATVGIFTGIFAKEAVIASLNSLYSIENQQNSNQEESWDFFAEVKAAWLTIPANLVELTHSLLDPIGFSQTHQSIDTLQDELDIDNTTISKISSSFGSPQAAMAYLIFILLYTPCVAALGAVYREAGMRWMIFVALWTFCIGWIIATGYYQLSQLAVSSIAFFWLIGLAALLVFIICVLKIIGQYTAFTQYNNLKRTTIGHDSEHC